ncbi:hypothetical protein [Mycobacterium intracellulare]|uniref:hypothetical protein n=1 Tax=Mycobacterium intracellulare TaxID=1767 RepID=UPI0012FD22CA|nr:hypothetical protein [Mycobacterium intracellulare]
MQLPNTSNPEHVGGAGAAHPVGKTSAAISPAAAAATLKVFFALIDFMIVSRTID